MLTGRPSEPALSALAGGLRALEQRGPSHCFLFARTGYWRRKTGTPRLPTWASRAPIWRVCGGVEGQSCAWAPDCHAGMSRSHWVFTTKKAGPCVQRSALRSRKQAMTGRYGGRCLDQESSEARDGAVRRSAPPGEGEGTNRRRQTLASPLTPHVRTVGSAWKPTQDEAEARQRPWRSPTGAAERCRESTSNGARPNKSPAASLGQGEVGRGIQDLTELVRVEHPPQDAQFLPVGTEFLRQPAGGTRGACERRTQDS